MGALRVGFLKHVIISYSWDTGFFLCVDRKERRRGWGSYMKWDLQISTQPIMGSYGWRGHWGAVDFPSWDRDIITLGVATQKSPSSVPRLVSANYKTQWMTFTHKKKTFAVFFLSFGCKVIHWGIILAQELLCHPLITSHNYTTLLRLTRICVWYFVHVRMFRCLWGRL